MQAIQDHSYRRYKGESYKPSCFLHAFKKHLSGGKITKIDFQ